MKKSIWRIIGAALLLGGVSNSLRNVPTGKHEPAFLIGFFGIDILLVVIAVWLAVSYFRR